MGFSSVAISADNRPPQSNYRTLRFCRRTSIRVMGELLSYSYVATVGWPAEANAATGMVNAGLTCIAAHSPVCQTTGGRDNEMHTPFGDQQWGSVSQWHIKCPGE